MTETKFAEPPVGTIRGPFRSSPGNSLPWQACLKTENGWVYEFAKTPANALAQIARIAKEKYG